MNFSKSKYTTLWKCAKAAWLFKYKPEQAIIPDSIKEIMDQGNTVGDLAMEYFGEYVDVTTKVNDKIDLKAMIQKTKEELKKGTDNICEASFEYNGLYCAVDILKKSDNGYEIYEVKSSSSSLDNVKDPKGVYIADIAYQKYVLEKCGIKVTGTYLMQLNKDYVLNGDLDVQQLFVKQDVAKYVKDEFAKVEENLKKAEKLLSNSAEPTIDLNCNCKYDDKECCFWKYCTKHLLENSVFDLYKAGFNKALDCYKKGIVSYKEAKDSGMFKSKINKLQFDHVLNKKKDPSIDKKVINDFIKELHYPIYYLDFESEFPAIPKYQNTNCYTQIPFQYSLHIEYSDGRLVHKEFLAESGPDPRETIAKSLVENIPEGACVIAYNKTFECNRLNELAELFPKYHDHLKNISNSILDLVVPFRKGGYYVTEMWNSFSIKSVLPALFPNDPELDYHALNGVHNGNEAKTIFPKIASMSDEDKKKSRENLLKYCCLDTYAMVKVLGKLKEVIKQ